MGLISFNEVYNNLKGWAAWDFRAYHLEKDEADIVIKALGKAKPQKLADAKIGTFTVSGHCPNCGANFFSPKVYDPYNQDNVSNYCRHCGQRITWEGKAEI